VHGGGRDVGRGEQEHLVGDPLDGAADGEDQAGGEVDEPLGVGVVHLGEVHDDRHALAEVLSDGAGLVVGARVQRGDPGELRDDALRAGLRGRGGAAALGDVRDRGGPGGLLGARTRGLLVVLVVVVLVVAFGVLEQAKVDTHLAHRAAHDSCLRYLCAPPDGTRCYACEPTG